MYHSICYNIFTNLDFESAVQSVYLFRKIINNDINCNEIAGMSSVELCPEKYEKISKEINQRANIKYTEKFSELYHCRKCKKNKTIVKNRYNRSLDEGTNITIQCINCSASWNG